MRTELRFRLEKGIHVVVFWVMAPCVDVVGYQHFGGLSYLYLQDEMNITRKGGQIQVL
jgi:hypothetical protein